MQSFTWAELSVLCDGCGTEVWLPELQASGRVSLGLPVRLGVQQEVLASGAAAGLKVTVGLHGSCRAAAWDRAYHSVWVSVAAKPPG